MSTPTIPQFTRDLFPTDGCQVGVMKLSESARSLVNQVVDGSAFVNPVQGAISDAQNAISNALNFEVFVPSGLSGGGQTIAPLSFTGSVSIFSGLTGTDGEPIFNFIEGYGNNSTIQQALSDLQGGINGMQVHTDRLSGVSMFKDGGSDFGVGGSSGEFGGIASLAGIASAYNSGKEMLKDPGAALEDHFSPIFNSVLGPGTDAMGTVQNLMDGDVLGFLEEFPGGDVSAIAGQIGGVVSGVQNLIDGDLNAYIGAVDYLAKQALGISVLDFYMDPCFLTKLMGNIGVPGLNELGQEIASAAGDAVQGAVSNVVNDTINDTIDL